MLHSNTFFLQKHKILHSNTIFRRNSKCCIQTQHYLLDVDDSLWSQWTVEIKEGYVSNNWESLSLDRMKELTANFELVDQFNVDPRSLISSVENMQHAVRANTLNLSAINSRVSAVQAEVADLKRDMSDIKSQMSQLITILGEKDNIEPATKKKKS